MDHSCPSCKGVVSLDVPKGTQGPCPVCGTMLVEAGPPPDGRRPPGAVTAGGDGSFPGIVALAAVLVALAVAVFLAFVISKDEGP
ncbi:MAG: hypothetical protein ACYSU0_20710, partial [Planctomycetota bacterium]